MGKIVKLLGEEYCKKWLMVFFGLYEHVANVCIEKNKHDQ